MIILTVVSYNGAPADALSARFDELGGSIGRADNNQLVLPDPDRAISRVHAQVVFRNGNFAIVDRGSNPILVNGREVGSGREQVLARGDQVQIGGYLLNVGLDDTPAAGAGASADPFADLLGPGAGAPKAASRAPAADWDPLAAFAPSPAPAATRAPAHAPPPAPPAAMGGIPDDWDPFAPVASNSAPKGVPSASNSLGLELGAAAPAALIPEFGKPAASDSIDALFGLTPGGGADPLANSLLDAPAARPNMAAHADPIQSLRSAPQAQGQALSDDFSDLHRPFLAPAAPPQAPAAVLIPPPVPVPATAAPAAPRQVSASGTVLSWDKPAHAEERTVIVPGARAGEAVTQARAAAALPAEAPVMAPTTPAPVPVAVPAPMPAPVPEPVPVFAATAPTAPPASPAPQPATPAAPEQAATPADADALLQALRDGLALPGLPIDKLTPELMRLIGELLRAAAGGTVDLLVARAALKREVRAESTMIVARENNPLKFSPSADAALQHLLSPPMRGFMPAVPAMRDAYDDLRAHQFGFVAGMRAALAGVLERFDPAQLEGRLTQRSVLASLVPGSRKARMWDVFIEHYAQIGREAEDDFHTLFGKAFLKAYDEHIAQLRKDES